MRHRWFEMLTQQRLRHLLKYNPEMGEWTWLNPPNHNTRLRGMPAGNTRSDGYLKIKINGVAYYSSRLAWFYMTGNWPSEEIDHIDRDPSNDRWNNLRLASSSDNKCNSSLNTRNTSGYRGIGWLPGASKWQVHVNGVYLGRYDNADEAIEVRDSFAKEAQREFVTLNRERNAA
jgi:hypothetical protein